VKAAWRAMAENAVVVPGPAAQRLGDVAAQHGVTLVIGVVERVDAGSGSGTLYNTLLTYLPDGRLANHHRKLVPTYTERLVWGPGDAAGVRAVATPAGRVGGLVCWEHWMPLARQALHESGEDFHVAAWPTVKEMSLVASRQYAFEGRCWVLAAGSVQRAAALPAGLEPHPERVSGPDQPVVAGGSCIIAPDGVVVAGPAGAEPAILVADADHGRLREERMNLDVSGHYARPDCFRLHRVESGSERVLPGAGS
jgi:predicted amidohydrolase